MAVRNRLKSMRHRLEIDRQTDFAELLGVSPFSLNQWEQQKKQPNTETLCRIYFRLKEKIPDLHMEELIDYISESD